MTLPDVAVLGDPGHIADHNLIVSALAAKADTASVAVRQVKSTTKADTFTTTSTAYTDLTGLSVAITPSSATSLVLVMVKIEGASTSATADSVGGFQLVRGATPVGIGAAAGTRPRASGTIGTRLEGTTTTRANTLVFLDSPATTSATTYKVQVKVAAGTLFINRNEYDADADATSNRFVSTITVMEIGA